MSNIKVYVRVRPPLLGEFDTPGCFNCTEMEDVSGNWIQIKKEGEEKRYFARVWGPQSGQEEPFRTIGINTVNDVFEGFYGCIFVYGQTGTGKTFTLGCLTPGLEGIQPRCLQYMFEKIQKESSRYEVKVQQQYVQLYRDFVQDLLDITKDNLKVRVDDQTGATIEKVTTRDIATYEDAVGLIREGDSNRAVANTKMNSASSRSHACLITEVTRIDKEKGTKTFGRLYLIDLAGSERVSKSGVTDEGFKEAVAINKSLTTLGNCIAGLVNNEKTVSFRESPLTRILQHSLTGHGRTSIIITIRPDSPNMQETICTIKFGERAQKVEAQMTPGGYRDQVLEMISKAAQLDKECADQESSAFSHKSWASTIQESINAKEEQMREKEMKVSSDLEAIKTSTVRLQSDLGASWEAEKAQLEGKHASVISDLKRENASVIDEIEAKVKDAENSAREKMRIQLKPVKAECELFSAEEAKAKAEYEQAKQENEQGQDPKLKARLMLDEMEERLKVIQRKLKGCKSSPNEHLGLFELRSRETFLKEALMKLSLKLDTMKEKKLEGWDTAKMKRMFPNPGRDSLNEFVVAEIERVEPTVEETQEVEEVRPEGVEEVEETDSTEETDEESSDDSDYDSSAMETDSDADEKAADELNNLAKGLVALDGKKVPDRPAEHSLFDLTLKKDAELSEKLVKLQDKFSSGGTIVYVVDPPTKRGEAATVSKRFMFLLEAKEGEAPPEALPPGAKFAICFSLPFPKSATPVFSKDRVDIIIKANEVGRVVLGQYSQSFFRATEGCPVFPPGSKVPTDGSKLTVTSLPIYKGRSLSLMSRRSPTESFIDLVFDVQESWEPWLIILHRIARNEPKWGQLMDVSGRDHVDDLTQEEKAFCAVNHIQPTRYLEIKGIAVNKWKSERRLFYTLAELKEDAGVDLLLAQRLSEFFYTQGVFDRINVFYTVCEESMQKEAVLQESRNITRLTRMKVIRALRNGRQLTISATQKLLRSCIGREAALLDLLVREFGPDYMLTEEELQERSERETLQEKETAAFQTIGQGFQTATAQLQVHVDPVVQAPVVSPASEAVPSPESPNVDPASLAPPISGTEVATGQNAVNSNQLDTPMEAMDTSDVPHAQAHPRGEMPAAPKSNESPSTSAPQPPTVPPISATPPQTTPTKTTQLPSAAPQATAAKAPAQAAATTKVAAPPDAAAEEEEYEEGEEEEGEEDQEGYYDEDGNYYYYEEGEEEEGEEEAAE